MSGWTYFSAEELEGIELTPRVLERLNALPPLGQVTYGYMEVAGERMSCLLEDGEPLAIIGDSEASKELAERLAAMLATWHQLRERAGG